MTFTNICIKFLPFFFQQLKITVNNFVSEIISRCFWPLDASGDANSVYSCRSLYGSSRTVRYLDADNSFSVPVVPLLLFCYVSRALLLPLSPAPLRIPPFSAERRSFRSWFCCTILARRELRVYACIYFIAANHQHSFVPSSFSTFPRPTNDAWFSSLFPSIFL